MSTDFDKRTDFSAKSVMEILVKTRIVNDVLLGLVNRQIRDS